MRLKAERRESLLFMLRRIVSSRSSTSQRYKKDLEVPNLFLSFLQICCAHLRAPFSIYASRDDSSCISSSFATREKSLNTNVLQCVSVSHNAYWRRGSGLYGYHHSLVGQEPVGASAKRLETFLQSFGNHLGQPEVQRTGDKSWGV